MKPTLRRASWLGALGVCLFTVVSAVTAGVKAIDPTPSSELALVSDMYIGSKGRHNFEVTCDVGAVALEPMVSVVWC